MGGNDPRVFFAAERTLLAWVRMAIAVIGLGFLVARFGLFQRPGFGGGAPGSPGISTAVGVALILLGAVASGVAAAQHARYCRSLPPADRPTPYATGFAPTAAFVLAAVGAVLAVYLAGSG